MTPDIGVVLVSGLAAFRLWVLLSTDTILNVPRSKLPDRVINFLSCPWCAGFWVAVLVYVIVWAWGDNEVVQAGVVILALSAIVGALGVWTGEHPE